MPGCHGRRGHTPYSGLYREAPPVKGTIFRLDENKRIEISRDEVAKGRRKSGLSKLLEAPSQ